MMQINLSEAMIETVINALRTDIKQRGVHWAGDPDVYEVTNTEALDVFEELLNCEKAGVKRVVSRTAKR
jgi:hypothetical protein